MLRTTSERSMVGYGKDFWTVPKYWQKNYGMREAFVEAYVDSEGY